jgi:hypothetical protein
MTAKTKTVLLRFARTLGALGVAALITWVSSPDVLSIVPSGYQWVVLAVVTPALVAAEKWLRYGADPGE